MKGIMAVLLFISLIISCYSTCERPYEIVKKQCDKQKKTISCGIIIFNRACYCKCY